MVSHRWAEKDDADPGSQKLKFIRNHFLKEPEHKDRASSTPILRGEHTKHKVLNWLDDAKLVQQMGFIHVLDDENDHDIYSAEPQQDPFLAHRRGHKNGPRGHEQDNSSSYHALELPTDQLHLKNQLRS
ncbi:hypothetical protein ACA910_013752 [Epithemia clementina (nom. ined.)]